MVRRFHFILMVFVAALGVGTSGAAEMAKPKNSSPTTYMQCVKIKMPKGLATRIEIDPTDKIIFKPMTRGEIKHLIDALKPVALKDGSGFRVEGPLEGRSLSLARMGVLIQDVTAVLANIHFEETLLRMKKLPGVEKHMIAWASDVSKALDFCGRLRYEEFGGDIAFQESVRIVLDNREILESVILEPQLPGGGIPYNGPPR